jgi:FKBP-type peptidyl-prolyl cis-trans isomerase FklB
MIDNVKRMTGRLFIAGALFCAASTLASAQVVMTNLNDSASYAMGINYVYTSIIPALQDAESKGLKLNPVMIGAAVFDVLTGRTPAMNDSVTQMTLVQFQTVSQGIIAKIASDNLKRGQDFLDANKKVSGVVTTPSGLQYSVSSPGVGMAPDANDKVTVRYKGQLIDGTVFDQTPPDRTAEFEANRVIKGWTEGLQLMKPGAKYRFFIPSELAYGMQGAGGSIGPNETLIFDVELVAVTPN